MYRQYVRQLKSQNRDGACPGDVNHGQNGVNGHNDVISRILRGDPEAALHAGKKKAIRLFVSSTFTDTKTERNYLMREVYPQIRQLCQNHGVEFSIVDLRWGIRDTATNDHMTSEICLSEIEKCMTSSLPGAPCFMYLSFNRYGAPQLPRLVPAAEMEPIMSLMEGQEVLKDVGKWYLKDENACPPVYVLQPISTYMPEFLTIKDIARIKELRKEWYRLSDGMMTALREAAVKCTELTDQQRMKWQISTTHHEVLNGLLRSSTAHDQGLCYIRNIWQFGSMETVQDDYGDLVWRFIDLDSTGKRVDEDTQRRLKELQRLVKTRGVPCTEFECDWDPNGITEATHLDHIKNFAEVVRKDLINSITKAISKVPRFDSCVTEVASHVAFCAKKASAFHGRENLIGEVLKKNYQTAEVSSVSKSEVISEHVERSMFVVHGVSGSGKTSLMAKLVSETQDRMKRLGKKAVFVTRFCGTTPMSSSVRGLLQSMSEQITRAYRSNHQPEMLDVPSDFESLIEYFDKCLKNATEDQPLVIHIDSLDQLSDEDNGRRSISWLPTVLPDYVHLIVSTLPETGGCLAALRSMNILHTNIIEVPSLSETDSHTILQGWLESANRNLTETQLNCVKVVALDECEENPTTLRLRLLYDAASTWTSYQEIPQLPSSVKGLINMIFDNLEKAHGKALVSCFCGLIGVSRLGLPENDLIDIMSTDDEVLNSVLQYHKPPIPRIPYHVFARLRNDLGDYIIERGAHGKSVLFWYHRQFWETASKRYLSTSKAEERYASLIAKYYSEEAHRVYQDRGLTAQPLYWRGSNNECVFNVTKLSELPHALVKASDEDKNLYIVIDLKFIAAKCSVGLAREMLSDFIASHSLRMDNKVKYFLSQSFFMFAQNVHILEKEPQLILQQMTNQSDTPKKIKSIVTGTDLKSVVPWIPENQLYAKCVLVNKAVGPNPSVTTFHAEKFKGEIKGLEALGMGADSSKPYAVLATTHSYKNPSDLKQPIYEGRLDIYDANTGVCILSVACDHSVELLKLIKQSDSDFWIIYSSQDRLIRTVKVSLGQEPTATRSVSLNLETKVLPPMFFSSEYNGETSALFAKNSFAVSYRDGRVAATSFGQIGSRQKRESDDSPKRYFHCVFKMWKVANAERIWLKDPSCDPVPRVEIEPVLAHLVNPDAREFKRNSNPEGYYIGALAFSPDDRFIVMVLITEAEGETLSPFMSICDSRSMQPLWTMCNVEGNNRNYYLDLKRWISCLDSGHGMLFIVYSTSLCVTCIVVNSKDCNNIQGKRIWTQWMAGLNDAALIQMSKRPEGKAFVSHRHREVVMQYAPVVEVGDSAKWNEEEAELCRKIKPSDFDPLGDFLPRLEEEQLLADIGSDIELMHLDNRGFALTISETGKLKVTDLTKYRQYKPPDQHGYTVLSCCLSTDRKYVYTSSAMAEIGIWDATSGAKVAIHQVDIGGIVQLAGNVSIEGNDLLLYMMAMKIHVFNLQTSQEWDMTPVDGKPSQGVNYNTLSAENVSPITPSCAEVHISPDQKLFCSCHPTAPTTHIVVGLLEAGFPCHQHKAYDMPYDGDSGCFRGTYKSRFSPNGKYVVVFGVFKKQTNDQISAEQWPPQIKLFEMISWDELREMSLYRVIPKDHQASLMSDPEPYGFIALTFLPDNKHLVSGTLDGVVNLHNIPDIDVIASLKAHKAHISGMHAVSCSKGTFVLTCSVDHWIKVIRVQPQNLSVVALFYNAVAVLCITGFIDPDDVLYIHAGDTGGLLSVIKVDLKTLA